MATPSTTSKASSNATYQDSAAERERLMTAPTMCDDRKREIPDLVSMAAGYRTVGEMESAANQDKETLGIFVQEFGFASSGNQTPGRSQRAFDKDASRLKKWLEEDDAALQADMIAAMSDRELAEEILFQSNKRGDA
jgi:hypothetical protein